MTDRGHTVTTTTALTGSPVEVSINLLKCVVTCAVLEMPYCASRAGVVPAAAVCCIVYVITVRTTTQVATCAALISSTQTAPARSYGGLTVQEARVLGLDGDDDSDDVVSYMQLCHAAFGERVGDYIAWGSIMPCQWFGGLTAMVFLGQNTSSMLEGHIQPGSLTLLLTTIQFALCAPRSTGYLAYTSLFGNVAFVLGVGTMMYYALCVHGVHLDDMETYGTVHGTMEAFGIIIFSFSAQAEMLGILSSANANAKRIIGKIILYVQTAILVIFLGFSYAVYAAYGSSTKAIAFDMLPEGSYFVRIVRLLMTLMVTMSYPLVVFPLFHVFETTVIDPGDVWSRTIVRWTIILTNGIVAATFVDHFATITAISGGFAAVVAFILPPLFSLLLRKEVSSHGGGGPSSHPHGGLLERGLDYASIAMGSVALIMSVVAGVMGLAYD